jgi:uncharacterized membrane protein
MITIVRWRGQMRRGQPVDTTAARRLAALSTAEAHIVLLMVFVAAFMARGFALRG